MKYTLENVTKLFSDYEELENLAREFVLEKGCFYPVRLNAASLLIEIEKNTACNCHPEYEWIVYATIQDLLQWIEKKDSQNP